MPLVVSASSPTGIVFNPTTSFVLSNGQPATFLFAETVFAAQGPPLTSITGRVNPKKDHAFVDPRIDLVATPPYNVAYLDGRVYVSYAPPFGAAGDSAISVFKPNGKFERRLVTNHGLNGPWGMAIAPKHWGDFGGSLLVGNVFDGTIHAFNPDSGRAEGTLKDSAGNPLVNVGLWGIMFGNGTIGTPNDLVFAAGVGVVPGGFDGAYEHGLVGLITPVGDGDDD